MWEGREAPLWGRLHMQHTQSVPGQGVHRTRGIIKMGGQLGSASSLGKTGHPMAGISKSSKQKGKVGSEAEP